MFDSKLTDEFQCLVEVLADILLARVGGRQRLIADALLLVVAGHMGSYVQHARDAAILKQKQQTSSATAHRSSTAAAVAAAAAAAVAAAAAQPHRVTSRPARPGVPEIRKHRRTTGGLGRNFQPGRRPNKRPPRPAACQRPRVTAASPAGNRDGCPPSDV